MKKLYKILLFLFIILAALTPNTINAQPYPTNVGDSLALVDLYNNTNGPFWSYQWDLNQPVSKWRGVTFINTPGLEGRVVGLSLYSNNMTGIIPSSIANLTAIMYISFWMNNLYGSIPTSIGNLTKLEMLDLSRNQLTGSIPASIGQLTKLRQINFNYNLLSGKIPEEMVALTNLDYLYLDDNYFTFDGFEPIYRSLTSTVLAITPQANLTIHKNKGVLSVTANGTLANNSYFWHNLDVYNKDTTIIGDSTFTPVIEGRYTVTITNAIIGNNYRLYSDPITIKKVIAYKINPNPFYVNDQGKITTGQTFPLSSNVNGVATDGVTKLILTAASTVPVSFYINDSKDGSLSSFEDQDIKNTVLTVQPQNGRVSLIYNAPDGYGKDAPKGGRKIVINTVNSFADEDTVQLLLLTPPVVLVHGMWSSPEVWKEGGFLNTLAIRGIHEVRRADYGEYSSLTFAPNNVESIYGRIGVWSATVQAINDYNQIYNVAASQVDVVGHSLGGLMSRSFSQQPEFVTKSNYYKGYIHKLITIGTPHRGSPLGPVLWQDRDKIIYSHTLVPPYVIPVKLSLLAKLAGKPIGTVHRDFGIESAGIQSLSATLPFKTYAITADYLPTQILDFEALSFGTQLLFKKTLSSIFASRCNPDQTLHSDVIVPLSSQKGYINSDTVFTGTTHSTIIPITAIENTETSSISIQNKVANLLLSNNAADFSNGFPAPSLQPLDCNTASQRNIASNKKVSQKVMGNPQNKYVEITSPASGSVYNIMDGSTITLGFQTGNGLVADSSFFMVQDIGIFTVPANATATNFTLPANIRPGNFNIVLFSKDAEGNLYADTSHIIINVTGTPDSIGVDPLYIYLDSAVKTNAVTVYGYFKNGVDTIKVNISKATSGTQYASQKAGTVFQVSADGIITAVAPGTDTLIINNAGFEVKIPIVVAANFIKAVQLLNNIDFAAIPDQPLNDTPVIPEASAASGEEVNFAIVSGPAEIINGIVFVTGIGTVTVQATSPGNAYFANANSVTRSFNVTEALPVTLVNLQATRLSSSEVNISWQTSAEQNNRGFSIERKTESESSFTAVAFINSKANNGNSSTTLNYSYKDMNGYNGNTYYRLMQTDFDNANVFSPIKQVKGWAFANITVQVWPNPAKGKFSIRINGATGTKEVLLTDMLGRDIKRTTVVAGAETIVQGVHPGMYILTLIDAFGINNSFKQKIIVTD